MKPQAYIAAAFAAMLFSLVAICHGQTPPTPAQLQQAAVLAQATQGLATLAQQQQANVQADATNVAQIQSTLTTAQGQQAADATSAGTTAVAETASIQAQITYLQSLLASTSASVGGPWDGHGGPAPGPHGDDHPDDHRFDGHPGPNYGYGGGYGWQQPVNPFNFVAPIIANIATAPRMIVNPMTGQAQLMSPGQWVVVNQGTPAQTATWQPMAVWPLVGADKPATITTPIPRIPPVPALPHPIKRIRGLFRRLFHRS